MQLPACFASVHLSFELTVNQSPLQSGRDGPYNFQNAVFETCTASSNVRAWQPPTSSRMATAAAAAV